MAFSLKTWVNRISEYPNRRKLTHEDGSTELVTVARAEGQISAEGNAFSAEEMNDLENRIKGGFDEVNQSLTQLNEGLNSKSNRVTASANNICCFRNLKLKFTNGNAKYNISKFYKGTELIGFCMFPYNNITNGKCTSSDGILTIDVPETTGVNGEYYVSVVLFYDDNYNISSIEN